MDIAFDADDFNTLLNQPSVDSSTDAGICLSVLDQPIAVTRFPSMWGTQKTERHISMRSLAAEIATLSAATKAGLPWYKLATFGNQRSDKDCLRTNDNLTAISGVEGDYDGGEITLEEAEARLRRAGIAAMLYTTPNHMAEGYGPRWRVFAPFGAARDPNDRDRFMARLHGVFDGELDGASFTLSQAYYAGSVDGRPNISVLLVDGRPIDAADDLDAAAKFKNDGDAEVDTGSAEEQRPLGYTIGQIRYVLDCLRDEQWKGYYGGWFDIICALHHETVGSEEGFDLALEYSKAKPDWEPGCLTLRKWNGLGRENRRKRLRITLRKLLGWTHDERKRREDDYFINVFCDPLPDPDDDFDMLLADLPTSTPPASDDDQWNGGDLADKTTARLNKRHAVVTPGGRTLITTERTDGSMSFGTRADLMTFYANDLVPTGDGKMENAAAHWLRNPYRRTYSGGVTFAPGGCDADTLNLWRGWAVQPDPEASCELILQHLRKVVCRGVEEHADYLIGWLAHMVQHPDQKPGVALVLRGTKGVGKDTVADYLAQMIGRRHAPTVAESDHIVGKFNARLENAILLHVQEGSWAGDRRAESVLKYLVTSDYVEIERKGIDSFNLPSVLRIFISANADWVVPASPDERRWAVFEVPPWHVGDEGYFTALRDEMNGDGPAALLHYLQNYDLSGFNVRKAPETEGLLQQKLNSLRGVELWWQEILHRGVLPSHFGPDGDWAEAVQNINRDTLRQDYVTWSKGRKYDGEVANDAHFGRRLRDMLPGLQDSRPRVAGSRVWQYVVPPLADCRSAFDGWIGGRVDWEAMA